MMKDTVSEGDVTKWIDKITPFLERLRASNDKGDGVIDNINSYVSDSRHFLEKGDLVLAFESMIWAWALFETGQELGAIYVEEQ